MIRRAAGLALPAALLPGVALAHATERAVLLTLPTGPFVAGAGLAVLLTALAGTLLPGRGSGPRVLRLAGWRDGGTAGSWAGFALLLVMLAAGVRGSRDPLGNPLPLALWTVVWVGLVLASVLLGDLWRPVAPWRGPVRLARRLLGRTGGIGLARLGAWPAVAGFLGFAWLEIVSPSPADPPGLAKVVAAYWLAVFLLAVAEGEDWLDRGEMMTLCFAMLSRLAPLWRERGDGRVRLMAGWPGAQILRMPPPSMAEAAFVTLLVASVSFDGLHETFRWLGAIGVNPLEFPGRSAVMLPNTLGLLAMWAAVAGLILAAIRAGGLPRRALLGVLPIAAGYHLAHYLTALLTDGQYVIAALNDPLDRGDALLGLPPHWVSFGFLTWRPAVRAIWSAQFLLILGAHLLAVLLTLRLAPGRGTGHLPLAALMVGFTCFGLWLLAAAAAG